MWSDGGVLRDRFLRLFELSVDPNVIVVDMRKLGWEVGGDRQRWRMRLFA